jgi:outer membrane protein assembly factor BamB
MRQFLRLTGLMAAAVLCGISPAGAQLIAPSTALRYGLARPWYAQIGSPQVAGALEHVNYDEGLLLVQSRGGVLTAIDAETGRTLWSTQVGERNRSTTEPAANSKYVVVLNGSTLFVVDRASGDIVWQRMVGGAPGAGPGVSQTHAFVPLVNGKLEGYDLEKGERQTPWNYQSSGRVLSPPMTTDLTVSWTTERGYFYVADPAGGGIRYRLETRDEIQSRPASWTPELFAGSTDGYVYAVEETRGNILWKFPVGEAIYEAPVAIEDQLYVVTEFGGMYVLNARDGSPLWHVEAVRHFAAKSPTRVYVVNTLGNLAILDAASGAPLGTMRLPGSARVLVNHTSDRIFVVDRGCVIQCLHETGLASPVVYTPPLVEKEEVKLKDRPPRAAPAAEAPEKPAEAPEQPDEAPDMPAAEPEPTPEDPADNPFDQPEGGEKPAEPPAGEAENPFNENP